MKIRVNSSMYMDVTKGHNYTIYTETNNFYLVIDDVGDIVPIRKEDCEIVEETSEWSGEGIPPVGTVCECITEKDVYLPCKVIAHGIDHAEYVIVQFYPNEYGIKVDWTRSGCRPIKSKKQKEIDKIASELLESVNKNGEDFRHLEWEIAEHLYNVGLRFTRGSK